MRRTRRPFETSPQAYWNTPMMSSAPASGNNPAGETVKVEIKYIMELKHDAKVDGLRFTTLPASHRGMVLFPVD